METAPVCGKVDVILFRVGRRALSCPAWSLSRSLLSPGFRLATFGPCGRFPRFLGSPLHGRGLPPWEALWPSSPLASPLSHIRNKKASLLSLFRNKFFGKKRARLERQAQIRDSSGLGYGASRLAPRHSRTTTSGGNSRHKTDHRAFSLCRALASSQPVTAPRTGSSTAPANGKSWTMRQRKAPQSGSALIGCVSYSTRPNQRTRPKILNADSSSPRMSRCPYLALSECRRHPLGSRNSLFTISAPDRFTR